MTLISKEISRFKLHLINDEDAIELGKILLKSSTSHIYGFTFQKITRIHYDRNWGVDAEETVNVYFNGMVKEDVYRKNRWNDKQVMIQLVSHDRYHDYPYFNAFDRESDTESFSPIHLSNHIEAVEFLQKKQLI